MVFQGLNITVVPSEFEENLDPNSYSHPREFVMATAHGKTLEVIVFLFYSTSLFVVIHASNIFTACVSDQAKDKYKLECLMSTV